MQSVRQNERTAWNLSAFLALSFGAMAIWPLLGIAASSSMFEKPADAVLLFGGLSGLLLLPIYAIFPMSETAFGLAIIAIWLLLWIAPSIGITRRPPSQRSQLICLAILSGISLFQSALGFLMILGRGV